MMKQPQPKSILSAKPSRRKFIVGGASTILLGGCSHLPRPFRWSPGETINVGCVGVGGKGEVDMTEIADWPNVNIVALCDVDEDKLAAAQALFPKANAYVDWRKLLEQNDIDAVSVTTPDHMHAPVGPAMELGKHVYDCAGTVQPFV